MLASDSHLAMDRRIYTLVVVLTPIPKPDIIRPTIMCARVNDVACSSPPTTRNAQPNATDLRLPSQSPVNIVKIAPKMHPRV